jgi:hypothetical protein
MNTINEKVEPPADLLIEVDLPEENMGSASGTSRLDMFEDWLNFLKDVVKILAE